ncbi:MAG: hypothetical protein IPP78_08975 [Holophagaceae bacterium]|nr:hypothetical protein [Holophagaceae bacterium]
MLRSLRVRSWASALVFALSVLPCSLHGQVKPTFPQSAATESAPRPEKDDPQARLDATRAWFGGDPSPEYLDAKKEVAKEVLRKFDWSFPGYQATGRAIPAVPGSNLTWTNIGPFGGSSYYAPTGGGDVDSGRLAIQGILTHPTNPQILYIGTAGGGVWKTINADLLAAGDWTWTCITDNLPVATGTGNCAVGAIAMSPVDPETIYLGLGDAFAAQGRGIYKSTNGGSTWAELGALGNTTFITSILPLDANVVLVGGSDGIWRSTNGGASFNQLSGSAGKWTWSMARLSAQDLVLSLTDAGYANGKIYYSSDSGLNFTVATGNTQSGRITLATSPASSTAVWGIEQDASAPSNGTKFFTGVLKSIDKGATWSYVPAPVASGSLFQSVGSFPDGDGGQAFYDHLISVDPLDANKLIVGSNLSLYRTQNGGVGWEQLTHWVASGRVYAHADFHTATWSKTGTKVLFFGNDGGLSILRDPYRTPIPSTASVPNSVFGSQVASDPTFLDSRRSKGIATHLVYSLGSTTAANSRWRVSIGLQDNATRIRASSGSTLFNNNIQTSGDGFGTIMHLVDGNKIIGSGPNTYLYRSTDGGNSFTAIAMLDNPLTDPQKAPFLTRIVQGLSDPTGDLIFTATNRKLWGSLDFGTTWFNVLNNIGFTNNIRHIASSKSSSNALAVVTSGGTGAITPNAGSTWQNFGAFPGISSPEGPISDNGYNAPSYVWFDTSNANTLYVASASFTFNASHLWKSTNQGQNWTALDGGGSGFPAGPVHVIQNDPTNPSTLLAGTDYGLFSSSNGGTTWTRYGQGLPMVAVRDLYIAPDGKFIRAATFGRGVWEIGDSSEQGGGDTTTQLLLNPGFESGNTIWTPSNNDIINASSVGNMQVRNGTWGAWMSGYGVVHTDTLSQDVALSASATHVELNFWLKIVTNGPGNVATDTLKVQIRNTSGGLLGTLATLSNLDAPTHSTFVKKSFDVTQYKGQTIRVYLEGVEDASLGTSFFVDDFELNATTTSATGPTITIQPVSHAVTVGQSASFTVAATGTAPLAYQWRRNGTNIVGATGATYTFTANLADNGAQYSVVVSNGSGNATSANATLTVNSKSGDLNGDGQANVLDLATFIAAYSGSGIATSNPAADLDGDGDCDDADLALLLAGI